MNTKVTLYTNFLGVSPFCYILNFYFFLPNRILVKHLENHSFTLPSYPTREYIPSTKNRSFFVAEQTICSSPGGNGVHFFGLFLQTQPQGFPPPPSPIREFRRNLMEIV